ncbi:MAG: cysteine hydrolase family protein [Rhodospirillales bacterium]|jgi:nicotinamidase-related amidase
MTADYINDFNSPFLIRPQSSALVVVDLQYATGSLDHGLGKMLREQGRLEEADYRFSRINNLVLPNTQRLLKAFRDASATVVYVTYGAEREDCSDVPLHIRRIVKATNNIDGHKEHEIVSSIAPKSGEIVLNKVTMGAFGSTGIESRLRAMGVTEIVTVGVSTNNCVGMTAMEASDRGFGVVLVSDATGTCDEESQEAFEAMFLRLWGRVLCADEVMTELNLSR